MKTKPKSIQFDIITIFPHIFDSYLNESLFKKARNRGIVRIQTHDLRDYSGNRYRKVDDRPFGGGPGMVLQIAPIYEAVRGVAKKKGKRRIVLFSTRGKQFNASAAKRLSRYDQIIFICGRYEGVDERVAQYIADEEISMGNYVLSGGELPALVAVEAISRFLPGFLGTFESLEEIKGSYPVYTRPETFSPKKSKVKWRVPKILLSGDHKKINEYRKQK